MAGDWIKMRTDLYRDPKVILIADELMSSDGSLAEETRSVCRCNMSVTRNVMRNATVGALVSVWGVARHQGKRVGDDLRIFGVTLSVIDDIADLTGFGAAMAAVCWAIEDSEGVIFPRFFEENNSEPIKSETTNAVRQRRYRERKKALSASSGVGVTSVTLRNDRIEKRREEKNKKESKPKKTARTFSKPTPEEVAAYISEQGYAVDPQQWYDHYEANGWRVGRVAMKDWRAAVRTWAKNEFGNGKVGKVGQPSEAEIARAKEQRKEARRKRRAEYARWELDRDGTGLTEYMGGEGE